MSKLNLNLREPGGDPLNDDIHLTLFDLQSQDQWSTSAFVRDSLTVDLPSAGNRTMRVLIEPANHRDVTAVFFAGPDNVQKELLVPVNPEKVRQISAEGYATLPVAAKRVLENSVDAQFTSGNGLTIGEALYAKLSSLPLLKACFLNIVAKSGFTPMGDGCALDFFQALRELQQDRFFVGVAPELLSLAAHSNALHEVDASLHTPLPGFTMGRSYKTFDRYGNLQLTFQTNAAVVVADVDIDDAQGIEHIYQVVRNWVDGPTNPYDIHDILLSQDPPVNPDYDFVFGAPLTATT